MLEYVSGASGVRKDIILDSEVEVDPGCCRGDDRFVCSEESVHFGASFGGLNVD